MSQKRIMVEYPSVTNFLSYVKKRNYSPKATLTDSLIDFFDSNESLIRINPSKANFNILVINTASKLISGDVNKLITGYEELLGKIEEQIKVFIVDHNYPIEVIGKLPSIISLFDRDTTNKSFDLILCQCELLNSPIIPHLKDLIKNNGLLITDKKHRLNVDDVNGWAKVRFLESFHAFQPIMSNRVDLIHDINDSDITLKDFISFGNFLNLDRIPIDEHLKNFIHNLVDNTINKIRLTKNAFNVLIMCSNTPSIKREKFVSILQRCIDDNVFLSEDTIVYHIGKDIYQTTPNYIFRGTIDKLDLEGSVKFDMIVSEHCPTISLTESISHIRRLLKHNCVLITPSTSFDKHIPDGFTEVESNCADYMILYKNDQQESLPNTPPTSFRLH